jgi:hypothetical protein
MDKVWKKRKLIMYVEPPYSADVIHLDGFTYVVDNRYPIGDKCLCCGEHDHPKIVEIKSLKEEDGYYRVNGDWKTYYWPDARWGVFHILSTNNPKGR